MFIYLNFHCFVKYDLLGMNRSIVELAFETEDCAVVTGYCTIFELMSCERSKSI